MAAVALTGLIGLPVPAIAASSFWDSDSAYYFREEAPPPAQPKRRGKPYPKADAKLDKAQKEAAKPQGPLVIAVSIERQTMKVYDANGLFAETPVSTGMRGHSTPMGVFSVIQKNKYHRSNLYSGAPMPYMQRITWSGVAMHAGALPGYPASHGCIRMPMSFAMKMWNWTRMGARVVVTPGELTPAPFSHALLAAQKPAPAQAADAGRLDLRPALLSPGHATSVGAAPSSRDPVRTADAGSTASATPTASDAGPMPAAADGAPAKPDQSADQAAKPSAESDPAAAKPAVTSEPAKPEQAKADDGKSEPVKSEPVKTEPVKADAGKPDAVQPDAAKSEPAKADAAPAAPKRSGQIAAFVSRKDSRLYVRQNFVPLFDVPVQISGDDRPLGTHVFTARLDKDNPAAISWSVVSLPQAARRAEAGDDDRATRRRKTVGAIEVKAAPQPASSAAEALDRLSIPADAMATIAEALSTGGSLIVSDQGIASGETGAGTDFIIPLR